MIKIYDGLERTDLHKPPHNRQFRTGPYRRRRTSEEGPPKDSGPFRASVHRNLRPVLDRIKVPEPVPFVPDPFQTQALETLEESDVLVTAPTGAGKTYIAVEAIRKVAGSGGRSWYASPLKALSNAKYEEFSDIFGRENVGILTGDRKENLQASIIVGTTEILRNQLYDTMHRGEDLDVDLVVLDEAHYLGDQDRGVVWEEVLIYLPARVKLLLLSATIQNAQEICDWLEWLRQAPCRHVSAFERPVPLYPLFLFPSGELCPLGTRRGLFSKIRTVNSRSLSRSVLPTIPKVMAVLRQFNLLPAIFFLKSRADCDKAITLGNLASPSKNRPDGRRFQNRVKNLLDTYPFLRRHQQLSILRNARVGAHHGGQLPHWKLFLEKLMQDGYLDAIFSTSTVAAGVNFPARTVVIFQSDRFNGREFVQLTATDLLQMTGRAGRRGMDEIGFVCVVPGTYQDPQLVHDLLKSPPDPIVSQIRVNFSMVLNLLLSHSPQEIHSLFASSLATYQNLSKEAEAREEARVAEEELGSWVPEMACGSPERLREVRPRALALAERLRKSRKAFKRQVSSSPFFSLLQPGRVFFSRRGTPYVAVADPQTRHQLVEAVRLAPPVRFRKGRVRTHRLHFRQIHGMGEVLEVLPAFKDREAWEELLTRAEEQPFGEQAMEGFSGDAPGSIRAASRELDELLEEKASLPCDRCALYGPCLKGTSHPFAACLQRDLEVQSRMETAHEELWRSFLKHFEFLRREGYVEESGHLTEDGLWASNLRLDQPLLISECIRSGLFPTDDPDLLAALIAPFVMDRERLGDMQLSTMVYKFPDLAKPFFKMLQNLQPLRENLNSAGFSTPPLAFWTMVTVYHWARGMSWEEIRELAQMDEGDLAMVILRTADHLRQIESLSETHPRLAASATRAIERILREPVLVE